MVSACKWHFIHLLFSYFHAVDDKGLKWEGRIELDQVEGREKAHKFKQFEIATKVRTT